jgi:hypothetical protein
MECQGMESFAEEPSDGGNPVERRMINFLLFYHMHKTSSIAA